jgi:hypothetical protein
MNAFPKEVLGHRDFIGQARCQRSDLFAIYRDSSDSSFFYRLRKEKRSFYQIIIKDNSTQNLAKCAMFVRVRVARERSYEDARNTLAVILDLDFSPIFSESPRCW